MTLCAHIALTRARRIFQAALVVGDRPSVSAWVRGDPHKQHLGKPRRGEGIDQRSWHLTVV